MSETRCIYEEGETLMIWIQWGDKNNEQTSTP